MGKTWVLSEGRGLLEAVRPSPLTVLDDSGKDFSWEPVTKKCGGLG